MLSKLGYAISFLAACANSQKSGEDHSHDPKTKSVTWSTQELSSDINDFYTRVEPITNPLLPMMQASFQTEFEVI